MGQLLSAETELVVRTSAVPDWNSEYKVAQRYGIPTIKYAKLLGWVMQERTGSRSPARTANRRRRR